MLKTALDQEKNRVSSQSPHGLRGRCHRGFRGAPWDQDLDPETAPGMQIPHELPTQGPETVVPWMQTRDPKTGSSRETWSGREDLVSVASEAGSLKIEAESGFLKEKPDEVKPWGETGGHFPGAPRAYLLVLRIALQIALKNA